ncbi:MAG: 50S ribosomal protein L10 [Eubacteriales bacterium SKADARSKE-1]|nr:50S ribosomal protein L10 [Eubacteriales bacterium SKADARSKE-1]
MPSNKVLEQKKVLVSDLSEKLKGSCAGVFVDYKGISVADDTKLRKELREAGVEYSVIKNTMLLRASEQAGLEGLDSILKGTTAVAISKDDYVSAAKILAKFSKDNKFFKTKAGFVDGRVIGALDVEELAKLPSKEVLLAQVLGTMNAPIAGLATVLNGTIRGLAIALSAIAEKQSA